MMNQHVIQPLRRGLPILIGLVLLSLVALIYGVISGSADIPATDIWWLVWTDQTSVHQQIIQGLRLPRVLSAFAVGGVLALAGALMQVLLRNPLGDPYVLGVSGGAATAVMAAMLFGFSSLWYTPMAFTGAIISMLLVFALAHASTWDTSRLLLTGVVMAAGWSAIISFILSLSPAVRLPGMIFWLMGDLSDALSPSIPLTGLALGLTISLLLARDLNLASRGELQAAALGVNMRRLQVWIYLLASMLTATAVTLAGTIGFIGLIVPHMVRQLTGSDHRLVLPGSVLLGGSLLVFADTVARTLIAPRQLPVGVLTAMIGVPVFLLLLHRLRRPAL